MPMTGVLLRALLLALLGLGAVLAEDEKVLPVELAAGNFTSYLQELPETRWVLMEFYAHWCGACRHFQPDYERVATFFAKRGELQPKVVVARVDCANEGKLCERFKVAAYPSLKVGLAPDFAAEALDSLTVLDIWPNRNMDGVITFLEKHLDVKLRKEEFEEAPRDGVEEVEVVPHVHDLTAGPGRKEPPQVDLNDVEGATVKSWEYLLASSVLEGLEPRVALLDWLDLLAGYHPVPRCQAGSKAIRQQMDTLWPADADRPSPQLKSTQICPGSRFKGWTSCKGSKSDSRGYSCGLWCLLHALAARMPEAGNSGAVWLAGVKGFIKHYFQCSECATHFVRAASAEDALRIQSKRDAMLWAWVAHNKVNGRLSRQEKEEPAIADAVFPHLIWPTAAQCPECRKSAALNGDIPDWDHDAVYQFLLAYYSGGGAGGAAGGGWGAEQGLRGLLVRRTKRASWAEAGLVCGAVGAVVYMALKGSAQYRMRKSESRLL